MIKKIILSITLSLILALSASIAFAGTPDGAYGPYADAVESANQGLRKDGTAVLPERSIPENALGTPDSAFFSLGFGGDITLSFDNYISTMGALDIKAYEITNLPYPEENAEVWVSQNDVDWTFVGTVNNYGESSVDLPDNLYWVKYVKIVDVSNKTLFAANADGYDLDAVEALYDTLPYGAITKPGSYEVVSGNVLFEAIYFDNDYDALQWAVRQGTCAAGTNTVFGNVDGHHDAFTWDGHLFQATADTTSWANGDYCLVVNPTNDSGEPDIRLTQFSIISNNEPPIANPDGPYLGAVNTEMAFDGTGSSDPDGDPLTYAWDFGDGNTSTGATPTHSYDAAGIYNVCLTVNDGYVDSTKVCTLAVVYDPAGGFVTGGGWIDSPAGAYTPDPNLTGKATFGFVAKYKKGADVPDGNTEFQFKAGDLNFHSTSYDWLVVAGAKAMFKGVGTINGEGNYKFMISAIDGQINGGGGMDKFRIKIWEEVNGVENVIYDNQIGTDDNSDPTTVLSGGSIVIHN